MTVKLLPLRVKRRLMEHHILKRHSPSQWIIAPHFDILKFYNDIKFSPYGIDFQTFGVSFENFTLEIIYYFPMVRHSWTTKCRLCNASYLPLFIKKIPLLPNATDWKVHIWVILVNLVVTYNLIVWLTFLFYHSCDSCVFEVVHCEVKYECQNNLIIKRTNKQTPQTKYTLNQEHRYISRG